MSYKHIISMIESVMNSNNLNDIWVLREFTDNMDSEDGYSLEEYTKIGLIDYINDILSDMEDSEVIPYDITDEQLKGYLEYLGTDAQLVEIKQV